jgi:alpha-glucosidase
MTTSSDAPESWARNAVVYQVYPRSFVDSNGDGLGDIAGITGKVDYLRDLGVDAVWLSPFYPSALADGGYDVDDYRDVDPRLGTLADLDALIAALHGRGMKLVVDIVPNHTSNRHRWFRAALESAPGSAERARYIFRDGRGPDGNEPPSDWVSHFGGPAWTRVPDGQWYLHLFAPEQPDLDWSNREVRDEFLSVLKFWSDRGVDGYRIDVAHALTKDLTEPLRSKPTVANDATPETGDDPLFDRDGVHAIYEEWRELFDRYDPPRTAVAEAWVPASRRVLYARPTELGQAFNFDLLEAAWDAAVFERIIDTNIANAAEVGATSTWVLSNHDVVRHATRYGLPAGTDLETWLSSDGTDADEDVEVGRLRARAATALLLALPGSAYLYQGEELGLREVADIPHERLQDPVWLRSEHTRKGRDGCRVPLPWTGEAPAFGFSTAEAHLPQPAWFGDYAASTQAGDPDSSLALYREALRLRRALDAGETLTWIPSPAGALHFVRADGWSVIANFSAEGLTAPAGRVLLSSQPFDGEVVPLNTTVWFAPEIAPRV